MAWRGNIKLLHSGYAGFLSETDALRHVRSEMRLNIRIGCENSLLPYPPKPQEMETARYFQRTVE